MEGIVIGQEQGAFRVLDSISGQHAVVCLAHNALQSCTPVFCANTGKSLVFYTWCGSYRDAPKYGNINHAWRKENKWYDTALQRLTFVILSHGHATISLSF